MFFSLVKVALTLIFVTKTSPTGLGHEWPVMMQPAYYDCGSWIVYKSFIRDFLFQEGMDFSKNIEPFVELLYNLEPDFWKINIPNQLMTPKYIHLQMLKSNFYLIIGQNRQIIDVVTRMRNGHFIKCKLVDESRPEPSNIGQNEQAFECGHELFSNEIVQMSVNLALSNKSKNKLFLNQYCGPLYSPELNCFTYPLSREKNQHYAGKLPENTYYIVISSTGMLIDVIAELMFTGFIKCERTTKVPSNVGSDGDVCLGYLCGFQFFEISHMKRTAELAKARKSNQGRQIYPKKIKHDSSEVYIFPLLPEGRFYATVPGSLKHFVIMNLDFRVKSAAVKTNRGLKPCEETMRGIEVARPEVDNFICQYNKIQFRNERLLELIDIACRALGTRDRAFPAIYNGPAFTVHGPYVTWPIRYGPTQVGPSSKFRVIMNTECMLAGVIAKHNGKFYKCRRSKDNSIPGGESELSITEVSNLRHKKAVPNKHPRQPTKG